MRSDIPLEAAAKKKVASRLIWYLRTIMLVSLGSLMITVSQVFGQVTGPATSPSKTADRIRSIKELLAQRGYWITKVDSLANAEYKSAISAFRKLHRLRHTKAFSDEHLELLRLSERPRSKRRFLIYRKTDTERAHIEVDLARQVLLVVDSAGLVTHVLPVSSGNGEMFSTKRADDSLWWRRAVTPKGQYRISRKISGWRKSELGMLYYPLYYRGGAAIHGAKQVPDHPASHGCIRIPMFAAPVLASMVQVGHPILVY